MKIKKLRENILGFVKKNHNLVRSGTKVAFGSARNGVAARTAHCMAARSVECAFEVASCGKAKGVRGGGP